jgi:hypothetical protein
MGGRTAGTRSTSAVYRLDGLGAEGEQLGDRQPELPGHEALDAEGRLADEAAEERDARDQGLDAAAQRGLVERRPRLDHVVGHHRPAGIGGDDQAVVERVERERP